MIPAVANAKISMRLVSNQDYTKITKLFTDHFKSIAPDSVKVEVHPHHGGQPYVTPTDTDEYRAAAEAVKAAFGKEPVPMYEGGSIPIVSKFKEVLGIETILMGFGFDTDGLHSPNEHFGLWNFYKGIEMVPSFFRCLRGGKRKCLKFAAAQAWKEDRHQYFSLLRSLRSTNTDFADVWRIKYNFRGRRAAGSKNSGWSTSRGRSSRV